MNNLASKQQRKSWRFRACSINFLIVSVAQKTGMGFYNAGVSIVLKSALKSGWLRSLTKLAVNDSLFTSQTFKNVFNRQVMLTTASTQQPLPHVSRERTCTITL